MNSDQAEVMIMTQQYTNDALGQTNAALLTSNAHLAALLVGVCLLLGFLVAFAVIFAMQNRPRGVVG